MKIAPESGESGLLLVSAIHSNTISMYFSHLSNINFDESIDMLPTKSNVEATEMNVDSKLIVQDTAQDDQFAHLEESAANNDEDPTVVSRMTYVKAPTDQPLNLDMSSFD